MIIKYHKRFTKVYTKLPAKIKRAVDDRILLFLKDPFSEKLNNHTLAGKFEGYCSINITGDYRAIYVLITKEKIMFARLGTHSELYG